MGRRDELDAIGEAGARPAQVVAWRRGGRRLLVQSEIGEVGRAERSESAPRRYSSKFAGDTGNHLSPSLRTLCESYDAPVLLATGASTDVAR
jgi:hypothetical protein